MAYTDCRDRVVAIMHAVDGLSTKGGAPPSFQYSADAGVNDALPMRAFFFMFESGGMRGNVTHDPPRDLEVPVDLCIAYEMGVNLELLLELIQADYLAAVTALANSANWSQPTSTIENLFRDDDHEFAPFEMDVDEERRLVTVHIHMFWTFRPTT